MGRVIIILLSALLMLAGCKTSTEYVPVKEHHERIVTRTDTIHERDTVSGQAQLILQPVDSAYLARLGIVSPPPSAWLLHQTETKRQIKTVYHAVHDTVIQRDTVPKPYPVEHIVYTNRLYWWQHALMWAGAVAPVTIGIYLLRRRNIHF